MAKHSETSESEVPPGEESPVREVRYEHSRDFPGLLEELRAAILVSTYQAGKLVVVGTQRGQLTFAFHNFERVMGVATSPQQIAVGTRRQVYFLRAAREFACSIEPKGMFDACRHLPRSGSWIVAPVDCGAPVRSRADPPISRPRVRSRPCLPFRFL